MAKHESPPNKLTQRGIDRAADAMHWQAGTGEYSRGWVYPVYGLNDTVIARRWKAYDSDAKHKYLWVDGDKTAPYYHMGASLRGEIGAADGVVYLVNGEPAVLTMHAADLPNAMCFYGETHVPTTFAADLLALGVFTVRYYPDKDPTGLKSAAKLRDALQGSAITFDCRTLPDELPAKADLNDLWQLLAFDASAFRAALDAAPACALPAPAPIIRQRETSRDITGLDRKDEYSRFVEQHAPQGKKFKCINPEHDDHNPSARIGDSRDGSTRLYFCHCVDATNMHTVAKWLNLPSYREWLKDNYPNETKQQRASRKTERATQSAVMPITLNNQYHIDADYTIYEPHILALPVESAALQSGVGSFKTGFATREMGRSAGKAWYLTHREKLAEQEVERAANDGVVIELYNELPRRELYRAPRLSACINTLVLYVKETDTMPPAPDLLVIDEWSQFAESILIGGTLEGDELHIADQLVRYLLGNAKRVLLMDAHFSKAALDYARSARPGLPFVVNTYKTQRGDLFIVDKRDRAEAIAIASAMAGERIAVGSFGIDRGQANADQLADVIGDAEKVIYIHADNAGGERQTAWLKDPDGESKKFQAQVYSPLVGTGYSIDTPIDTLVVLGSAQQSAEDARQFVGRFRNVRKTYVFLPNAQDVRETDAQAITDRLISAAEQTAHPFIQDGRLYRSVSPEARSYAQHHAAIRAERNASMNNLRQRFVELCAGSYTINVLSGDDPAARALMNARLSEIDQNRKALALTAAPLDYEAFKQKQDAGQVSEQDHAGHRRWQIEHLTGATISEAWRDRLWTEGKRKAANRYADLLDEITVLNLADLEQAQNDTPLHKRQHRTPRRVITEAFLRPIIDANGKPIEYSAADLETVYRPIIEAHTDNLHKYFGWYRYRVNTAAGVIRLVLRRIGISFNTDRRRVEGERVQFYHLDADTLNAAVETARAIVAQRKAERDAEYEAQVTGVQKLQTSRSLGGFAISGQRQPPKTAPIIPAGATGWAAAPQEFAARMAALGVGY